MLTAEAFHACALPPFWTAALLHSIICNHPFVDGNKRTGWAAAEITLVANGRRSDLSDDEAFDLVLRIATACSAIEVKEIGAALRVVAR